MSTRVCRMVRGLGPSRSAEDLDRFLAVPPIMLTQSRSRIRNNEISRRPLVVPRVHQSNCCSAEAEIPHPTAMKAIVLRRRLGNSRPIERSINIFDSLCLLFYLMYTFRKQTCSNRIVRRASAASLTRIEAGLSSFSSFILMGSPGFPTLLVPDTPSSTTSNTVVKQSLSFNSEKKEINIFRISRRINFVNHR